MIKPNNLSRRGFLHLLGITTAVFLGDPLRVVLAERKLLQWTHAISGSYRGTAVHRFVCSGLTDGQQMSVINQLFDQLGMVNQQEQFGIPAGHGIVDRVEGLKAPDGMIVVAEVRQRLYSKWNDPDGWFKHDGTLLPYPERLSLIPQEVEG